MMYKERDKCMGTEGWMKDRENWMDHIIKEKVIDNVAIIE